MDLSKYTVTTPFGWVAGYPLNRTDPVNHPGQGFHNGIDYGVPMNTPVVVNGVEIARSNNTGATTGPHLHVGKYAGGAAVNPGVNNGTNFKSAVVFDTGKDATNGNFVRITADGALWNYLHLADGSIKVKAGQVLNGGQGDEPMFNEGDAANFNSYFYGSDKGKFREQIGKPWKEASYNIMEQVKNNMELLFNEGDRGNLNSYIYGYDRGVFSGAVGRSWKEAMYYGIFEDNPFKTDQLINQGDLGNLEKIIGAAPPASVVGKPWKNFAYEDLGNLVVRNSDGFTAEDRATANETNSIVKAIQDGINKLISYWKV